MLQTTQGIVLRTVKYSDTSMIADLYTRESGRTSFVVRLPRTRKAAVKPVLFQPLALVELVADFRPTATIYHVREAKSAYPFASLPYDPRKSAIALFLAEFLCRAVREEAENHPLYAYLWHSIVWLDECREGFANFHLVFLMRLARFLGLAPNLEGYRLAKCLFYLPAPAGAQPLHRSRGGGTAAQPDAYELCHHAPLRHEPHGARPLLGHHQRILPSAFARLSGIEIAGRAEGFVWMSAKDSWHPIRKHLVWHPIRKHLVYPYLLFSGYLCRNNLCNI